MTDMANDMSIETHDNMRAKSEDSTEGTPDQDVSTSTPQENPTQQKRKGGRKPIYATSEERKQRNRQAQAAFRERRTEYIKQLEETIRAHETNLHNLQSAHRNAADECLMLRYKNSLLERILLEKGIDVQAELHAKTGSPALGPTMVPNSMAQPPAMQRAIMNRHMQARRPMSNIAPKLDPGMGPTSHAQMLSHQSPQSRPTPSSHTSSPSASSPGFLPQGVMTPPGSEAHMPQQRPHTHLQIHQEQEYDAQSEPVDDHDSSEVTNAAFPRPYEPPMASQPPPMGTMGQSAGAAAAAAVQQPQTTEAGSGFNSMTEMMNPYDPMLDMDPFGLSASMHFPTQFSFDTSSMR